MLCDHVIYSILCMSALYRSDLGLGCDLISNQNQLEVTLIVVPGEIRMSSSNEISSLLERSLGHSFPVHTEIKIDQGLVNHKSSNQSRVCSLLSLTVANDINRRYLSCD